MRWFAFYHQIGLSRTLQNKRGKEVGSLFKCNQQFILLALVPLIHCKKATKSLGWGWGETKQEEIEGSKETTHLGWVARCHAELHKVALTRPEWEVGGCESPGMQLCWSWPALLCTKLKRPFCFWNQLVSLHNCTNVCMVLVNWLWKPPRRDAYLDFFPL